MPWIFPFPWVSLCYTKYTLFSFGLLDSRQGFSLEKNICSNSWSFPPVQYLGATEELWSGFSDRYSEINNHSHHRSKTTSLYFYIGNMFLIMRLVRYWTKWHRKVLEFQYLLWIFWRYSKFHSTELFWSIKIAQRYFEVWEWIFNIITSIYCIIR